jgi:hypothetical protein
MLLWLVPEIYALTLDALGIPAPPSAMNTISFVSVFVAMDIAACITMLAYTYKIQWLYYAPWFFIGIEITYTLWAGTDISFGAINLFVYYLYGGNIAYLIFMFAIGAKLRDNKLFGFAIFFVFTLLNVFNAPTDPIPYIVIKVVMVIFGFVYIQDKIHFFKPQQPVTIETVNKEGEG